jgi:hypothetical protein
MIHGEWLRKNLSINGALVARLSPSNDTREV